MSDFSAKYDVEIRDNRIEDTGGERQKVRVVIEREARGTVIEGNTFINMRSDVVQECVSEDIAV